MTEWLRPASIPEALTARAAHPDWVVLAGGTDLMVGAAARPEPPGVLDLFGLPGLSGVERMEGWLRIGPGTTYAALLADPLVAAELPLLREAAREVGAFQIQARGTIGGNVVTSSPVGDTLPCLLALDAVVELASLRGHRHLPYEAFLTGYRKTALEPDEIVFSLYVPAPAPGTVQAWRKVGTRRAQSISKVMMAAVARLDPDGRIAHVRVAFGAVADRPIRARKVEEVLFGAVPDAQLPMWTREALASEIAPITDVRSTADYRLEVAQNLLEAFVESLGPGSAR